jgi:hypothetical protein
MDFMPSQYHAEAEAVYAHYLSLSVDKHFKLIQIVVVKVFISSRGIYGLNFLR